MRFGRIEIDEKAREIRCEGCRVQTELKVFEFVLYLAANTNRVISKQELLDNVWSGTVVGDAAISRCAYLARKALGITSWIRTVHGRGYRFTAALDEKDSQSESSEHFQSFVSRWYWKSLASCPSPSLAPMWTRSGMFVIPNTAT